MAIIANKIFPGYLDRYLARHGYDAQQTNEPADPARPNNLWKPLDRDFGAHGRFDDRAYSHSTQLAITTHRGRFAFPVAAIAAGGFAIMYTIRRWNSMRSWSGLARMALRQPSKLPAQVIPFVFSKLARR
jgi:hypothetical protein